MTRPALAVADSSYVRLPSSVLTAAEMRFVDSFVRLDGRFGGTMLRHGHAVRGRASAEYRAWDHIRRRCLNPKDKSFQNYGGRGIAICERWRDSFEAFLADMGRKPAPELTIERVDNDGNYEPSNCKWATRFEQTHNRRPNKLSPEHRAKIGDANRRRKLSEEQRERRRTVWTPAMRAAASARARARKRSGGTFAPQETRR
jgi:hypothetical protein